MKLTGDWGTVAELIDFEVSPGVFIKVPDYQVPPEFRTPAPRLQLPGGGAPPSLAEATAPDRREALGGSPKNSILGVDLDDPFGKLRNSTSPQGYTPYHTPSLADYAGGTWNPNSMTQPKEEKKEEKKEEPKKAKEKIPPPDPRKPSSVMADTAKTLYGEKPKGGGGPGFDRTQLVAGEAEIERTPGKDLIPEIRERLFGEAPQDLGQELDPNAVQPTIGTEDPVTRPRLSNLNKSIIEGRKHAARAEEAKITAERGHELGILSRLEGEAEAFDERLADIADRRVRLANLKSAADKSAEEARAFEPRSHEQVWQSKGALARVSGVIAMALGGYVQGLKGGRNAGADMINKIVDDAVDDDREKAGRKDRQAAGKQNDYERAFALYGDPEAAALQTKINKLASVQGMLDQRAKIKGLDQATAGRVAAAQDAVEWEKLNAQQKLYETLTGVVTKEKVKMEPAGVVAKRAGMGGGGGGGGGAAGRGAGAPYGMSAEQVAKLSKENRALAVKLPGKLGFKFVRDPTARATTQSRIISGGRMIAALQRIRGLRADKSNTIPWSEKRGALTTLSKELLSLDKDKNQMGTLDNGLITFMAQKFGSPEEFNIANDEIDGKIEENLRLLENEMRQVVEYELDDSPLELTEGGTSADVQTD